MIFISSLVITFISFVTHTNQPFPAELFRTLFWSCISSAISNFKWRKYILGEKWTSPKSIYSIRVCKIHPPKRVSKHYIFGLEGRVQPVECVWRIENLFYNVFYQFEWECNYLVSTLFENVYIPSSTIVTADNIDVQRAVVPTLPTVQISVTSVHALLSSGKSCRQPRFNFTEHPVVPHIDRFYVTDGHGLSLPDRAFTLVVE